MELSKFKLGDIIFSDQVFGPIVFLGFKEGLLFYADWKSPTEVGPISFIRSLPETDWRIFPIKTLEQAQEFLKSEKYKETKRKIIPSESVEEEEEEENKKEKLEEPRIIQPIPRGPVQIRDLPQPPGGPGPSRGRGGWIE